MDLDKLVPPLELCKKIPKGEFKNCCFNWLVLTKTSDPYTEIVSSWDCDVHNVSNDDGMELYPAPTLQEILEKLPWDFEFSNCYKEVPTEKNITILGTEIGEIGDNGVESAMRAWLNLKGIKTNENE